MPQKIRYADCPETIANNPPMMPIAENIRMPKHIMPSNIHKNLILYLLVMIDIIIAKLYFLVNKQLKSTEWQSGLIYELSTFGKAK